jgi:hypothetical protein
MKITYFQDESMSLALEMAAATDRGMRRSGTRRAPNVENVVKQADKV